MKITGYQITEIHEYVHTTNLTRITSFLFITPLHLSHL